MTVTVLSTAPGGQTVTVTEMRTITTAVSGSSGNGVDGDDGPDAGGLPHGAIGDPGHYYGPSGGAPS